MGGGVLQLLRPLSPPSARPRDALAVDVLQDGRMVRHETQDKAHRAAMTRGYKDYIVQEVME